jgi:hypothetical protein
MCTFLPPRQIETHPNVNDEIGKLMPSLQGFAFGNESLRNTLAILRGEEHQYFMKREALLNERLSLDEGQWNTTSISI